MEGYEHAGRRTDSLRGIGGTMAITRWSQAQPGQQRVSSGRTGQAANPQQSDPAQNRNLRGLPRAPRQRPPPQLGSFQPRARGGGAPGQPPQTAMAGNFGGRQKGPPQLGGISQAVNRGDPYGRLRTQGPESLGGLGGGLRQADRGFNLPMPQPGQLSGMVRDRLGPQGPPGQKPPGGPGQPPQTAMASNFGGGK